MSMTSGPFRGLRGSTENIRAQRPPIARGETDPDTSVMGPGPVVGSEGLWHCLSLPPPGPHAACGSLPRGHYCCVWARLAGSQRGFLTF